MELDGKIQRGQYLLQLEYQISGLAGVKVLIFYYCYQLLQAEEKENEWIINISYLPSVLHSACVVFFRP